jgi:hypothetical protein
MRSEVVGVGSTNRLRPERPSDTGVQERAPDRSEIEGARLLANDAFPRLRRSGFMRKQIRLWAETYLAEVDSGDLEEFLRWIGHREGTRRTATP